MDKGNKVVQAARGKLPTGPLGFAGPEVPHKALATSQDGKGAPQILGPLAHIRDLQGTFSNKI